MICSNYGMAPHLIISGYQDKENIDQVQYIDWDKNFHEKIVCEHFKGASYTVKPN